MADQSTIDQRPLFLKNGSPISSLFPDLPSVRNCIGCCPATAQPGYYQTLKEIDRQQYHRKFEKEEELSCLFTQGDTYLR